MTTTYTLAQARALLPEARRRAVELAATVADLQRLTDEAGAPQAPPGTLAAAKAAEAHADEQLDWFRERDVQVRSLAPVLLDFPAEVVWRGQRRTVLLCWREGEDELAHFHPLDTGFAGREPVDVLDEV